MNQQRITKLQQQLTQQKLDGVILMPGPNSYYLSGMHTHVSERPVLLFIPQTGEPAVIIPGLEAMKAEAASIPTERIFAWNDEEWFEGAFQKAAQTLKLDGSHWGVEAYYMRVLELDALHKVASDLQTSYAEPAMMALRSIKDDSELAAMGKAIGVAERAIERLIPQIKMGMTEKQVAAQLTAILLDEGGESIAFGPIVSSGPNGASPHAMPGKRPLTHGDLLVIDWGVFVDDYPSDITRTFAVGEVDEELKHIYDIVRQANEAGKQAAKPGATGQDVDRAARKVITDAGYGEYFFHRTGHGLGLEVHELPGMVEGNDVPLQEGNVFTVEPGIYLAGRGGVRIEDDVVITADGCRSLTSFTRDLITVG
ncbi:MAG: M24 family metallopeptidase [Aquificales bacterium]|nr:M24 family metallopeptidase [Aquificales bacterium]